MSRFLKNEQANPVTSPVAGFYLCLQLILIFLLLMHVILLSTGQ